MKKPCTARCLNVCPEKIFGLGTMVGDRYMGTGAIGVSLRHHYGRMNNFQIANAVGMRLRCAGTK
jgi:hypothetical protein